jgi:hypothetical protein
MYHKGDKEWEDARATLEALGSELVKVNRLETWDRERCYDIARRYEEAAKILHFVSPYTRTPETECQDLYKEYKPPVYYTVDEIRRKAAEARAEGDDEMASRYLSMINDPRWIKEREDNAEERRVYEANRVSWNP